MPPVVLALALTFPTGVPAGADYEELTLRGEVVTLAEALRPLNLVIDPEPIAGQVVLKSEDGTIHPLLSDPASRALFLDQRLRNRPAAIQGRLYPGVPYLLVTTVQVEEAGSWKIPEYFCDVCTISVRFPQECPCCQGDMVLQYRAVSP
jgi:hypothetical protein